MEEYFPNGTQTEKHILEWILIFPSLSKTKQKKIPKVLNTYLQTSIEVNVDHEYPGMSGLI